MSRRPASGIYEFENFRLDAAHAMLYRDGLALSLPRKAVQTLAVLVARAGDILSKDELMAVIWADSVVEESNLSQYLHLLRKVLGAGADGRPFIETLHRRGYRFLAPVTRVDAPTADTATSTGIIGRDREVAEIARLLRSGEHRLLTLTGVGGVGKTTLAHMLAERLRDTFADGVHFVELAAITDPALVASTIAALLGVKEAGSRSVSALLIEHLRERRMLLVLDNFEQVIAAAPDIAPLLGAAPGLQIVVTSRIRLHLRAEFEYAVPSLTVPAGKWLDRGHPDQAAGAGQYDRILAADAVRLFISRACNVKPTFALTRDNAGDVAEICARLDGLPLAIELAAARIRLLSPAAILDRLENQLSLLTGGAKHLPRRQQTMRGIVAWSHDLLDAEERRLFRRLAVFPGSFVIEAAEAVCGGPADGAGLSVLDGVGALLDNSLLVATEQRNGEMRFRMLEVVREFAQEALAASGEAAALNERHARTFLALGEDAETHLLAARSAHWLDRLEDDHDNLRAALHWGTRHDPELAQRLAAAIWRFWWHHGHIREGREQAGALLARGPGSDRRVRTKLLLGAGFLNRLGGNFTLTRTYVTEALALARETGDDKSQAFALYQLGLLALNDGDFTACGQLLDEGLTHARASDDRQMLGLLCNGLGEFARLQGNFAQAEDFYQQALALNRGAGDLARQTTNLINLGATALVRNDLAAAGAFYREGLEISAKMADMNGTLYCLEGVAGALLAVRDPARAARLFGATEALREANNLLLEPADRAPYEQSVALVRRSLPATHSAQLFAEGRRCSLDEAVALALA